MNILHSVLDTKLKGMEPTVQCSDTAMTLKVKGLRTPHFLVDTGGFHLKKKTKNLKYLT